MNKHSSVSRMKLVALAVQGVMAALAAMPAQADDAKGLMTAAMRDDNPVFVILHKRCARIAAPVPEGEYVVPLGKARIVREGEALTVLAYGTMVHVVAGVVAEQGVDAEIIDLRTLVPLDIETIEASVRKTGRCMIVHEATRTSGFGAELSALVQERCFYHLEAPVERVTGFDTPYPHSLEWAYFPGPVRIGQALKKILKD